MSKCVKISVLIRYYNYVCKKLQHARRSMNESEIERFKTIKMALKFIDQPIYEEMAAGNKIYTTKGEDGLHTRRGNTYTSWAEVEPGLYKPCHAYTRD